MSKPSEVQVLLQELVRVPSLSGQEDAVLVRLAAWLRARGLSPVVRGRNLSVRVGRGDGPTLLLHSHTDTVPVGSDWTRDPFGGKVEAGRLYGRGANDAKGCVAAMAAAVAALSREDLPGTVIFAATCEEERGEHGFGACHPNLGPLDGAVFGEPTGLHPAVAQRGMLLLTLTAKGVAGHAARPHLAVNAIEAAARDVIALASLDLSPESEHLGRTTLAVTQIAGGKVHNVIPDRCELGVDLRTVAELPPAELIARIRQVVESEVAVRSDRFHPVATPEGSRLARAVRAAHPEGVPFGSPTLSDWAHLPDVPGVKLGPGLSEVSHTADEWIEVAQVERAVEVYAAIARAFVAG
ncbi:MAG: M20/M25/M40 family metallo-hydrolase [Deltaproteobacteria bacterium]|nr:M20/M25/M40 family metallo-hydrolase [Deltaproteobacteria bacterium]